MLDSQKETAQGVRCRENLKQLSLALLQYSDDWDNKMPVSNHWVDAIDGKYVKPDNKNPVFKCPSSPSPYGYAMNRAAGNVSLTTFDMSRQVLLFEIDGGTRNANGSVQNLAHRRHHMLNCSFCDGHVHWVNQFVMNSWSWSINKP